MKTEEVTETLVKIARAMQRGTIPHGLDIRVHNTFGIEVSDAGERALEWFRWSYPSGEDGPTGRTFQSRLKTWYDAWSYRVELSDQRRRILTVHYDLPHVHGPYVARSGDLARRSGLQLWRCERCREALTITAARELGLLPPKE